MRTAVGISCMVLTLLALFVAIVQVNIEASTEARRKGTSDKLALGDWAISSPRARGLAFEILGSFSVWAAAFKVADST